MVGGTTLSHSKPKKEDNYQYCNCEICYLNGICKVKDQMGSLKNFLSGSDMDDLRKALDIDCHYYKKEPEPQYR